MGEGSFGSVYQVTHRDTGVDFAAKCISPKKEPFIGMTKNEIETMKKIKGHKNILEIVDNYEITSPGRIHFWLVTDLCDLDNLENYAQKYSLTDGHKVHIMEDVSRGLAFLHGIPVLHRDVKPENVLFQLVGEEHIVKLGDYGASREIVHEQHMSTVTGTKPYMAPELFGTPGHVTYRDTGLDKFSAGIMFYQMMKAQADRGIDCEEITDTSIGQSMWRERLRNPITIGDDEPEVRRRVLKVIQSMVHLVPRSRKPMDEVEQELREIRESLPEQPGTPQLAPTPPSDGATPGSTSDPTRPAARSSDFTPHPASDASFSDEEAIEYYGSGARPKTTSLLLRNTVTC